MAVDGVPRTERPSWYFRNVRSQSSDVSPVRAAKATGAGFLTRPETE